MLDISVRLCTAGGRREGETGRGGRRRSDGGRVRFEMGEGGGGEEGEVTREFKSL